MLESKHYNHKMTCCSNSIFAAADKKLSRALRRSAICVAEGNTNRAFRRNATCVAAGGMYDATRSVGTLSV